MFVVQPVGLFFKTQNDVACRINDVVLTCKEFIHGLDDLASGRISIKAHAELNCSNDRFRTFRKVKILGLVEEVLDGLPC